MHEPAFGIVICFVFPVGPEGLSAQMHRLKSLALLTLIMASSCFLVNEKLSCSLPYATMVLLRMMKDVHMYSAEGSVQNHINICVMFGRR